MFCEIRSCICTFQVHSFAPHASSVAGNGQTGSDEETLRWFSRPHSPMLWCFTLYLTHGDASFLWLLRRCFALESNKGRSLRYCRITWYTAVTLNTRSLSPEECFQPYARVKHTLFSFTQSLRNPDDWWAFGATGGLQLIILMMHCVSETDDIISLCWRKSALLYPPT